MAVSVIPKPVSIDTLDYTMDGLASSGCSFDRGGYSKLGNLVIVNMRISLSVQAAVVYGFPHPKNIIGFCGYDGLNEKVAYLYMDTNGTLHVPAAYGSSGGLNVSFCYLT